MKQTNRFWLKQSNFAHSKLSLWAPAWKMECKKKINEEYQQGPDGLMGDASRWWKMDLEQILKGTSINQNLWLQSAKAARRKFKKDGDKQKESSLLRKWLRI